MANGNQLHVIILAAGKGTRMKSVLPKVLHPIGGKPMIAHVVEQVRTLAPAKLSIIIGHGADKVKSYFESHPLPWIETINWVEQTEQLGTGHAVKQVLPSIDAQELTLILYGDVPLTDPKTLTSLINSTLSSRVSDDAVSMGLLTVNLPNPMGYGRILRSYNSVIGIIEQKDANDEQLQINEVNTGIMAISGGLLIDGLPKLSNDNAQGEYYLTDMVAYAVEQGVEVASEQPELPVEVEGVNDKRQLAKLERAFQLKLADELMQSGATLADPARLDIRGHLEIGQDVFIDANVTIIGHVKLGDSVSIGPNTVIESSTIGANTQVISHSVIESSIIGSDCNLGPFARIRPGTELADEVKVGNFVETKKSIVGHQSKINHLSYVGDAEIGVGVNVGAGTITCNYDGVNKHKTIIEDGAFIGSNSALVAPVKIGENATVGAGTILSKEAASDKLTLARAKQVTIDSWKRPIKKSKQ